jgi:ATP-binding cassette subfamily B protein
MIKALKPYSFLIIVIAVLSAAANGLSLIFPKKIGEYVDAYKSQIGTFSFTGPLIFLGGLALIVLALTLIQSWISVYTSEKIGYDLRAKLIAALKGRSFGYIRDMTGGRLITVMTSDIDAIKNLISQAVPSILTAIVTLVGVIIFLLTINWRLALLTLSVMPFILITFALIFRKMGPLFGMTQINLDKINKTINESIIASPLVRVLDANKDEYEKFDVVNKKGTELSTKVVVYFSALIPIITLLSNISILIVLGYGGSEVIHGNLSLGQMTAFFSYTSVFVFPFFILGFASTFVSRAQISFKRIFDVIEAIDTHVDADVSTEGLNPNDIIGHIVFKNVTLKYGEKIVLKDISFEIKPHTRTALLGPTGAGKTELFYLMAGLAKPTEGEIFIDGKPIEEWNTSMLLSKIGMVFQDSIVFNTSLKENVLFKGDADEALLAKALKVSELEGLVDQLPEGLETNVSERGTSLSGGQKQRLMLARALSINPSILLLDDFTARVDAGTETRILDNIKENFNNITLISITQKIEPIKEYDHIIVLMEGELIAEGKHEDLIKDSVEYQQIYESQMSTETN